MLNIGIVGAGGMGAVHYGNYAYMDDCTVTALVGISEQDKKRSIEWNLPLYASIGEMLESQKVDVVDICTPTFLHRDHVMESLSHGKHTIVEKPLALSRAHVVEMFQLANEKNCFLYVAHVMQFTKETGILRELVRSETYGKPLDAYFERLSGCPEWAQGGWLFDKSKSGLLPYDLHIHDLDMIVSLFGKPEIVSITKNQRKESAFAEHYRMLYHCDGVHVAAEFSWFHANFPFSAKWRVVFEHAVVVYDGVSLAAYPYHAEPVIYDIKDEIMISTGINVPPSGWYLNELGHFISCIKKGVKTDLVSEEQLLAVFEVLEEIEKF